MADFFAAIAEHYTDLNHQLADDVTVMVQNHARMSGWNRQAWEMMNVEYDPVPDESGSKGFRIVAWAADGDFSPYRNAEYGFNGVEPNPAMRRMNTRLPEMLNYSLEKRWFDS